MRSEIVAGTRTIAIPANGSSAPYSLSSGQACGPDTSPVQAMKIARPMSLRVFAACGGNAPKVCLRERNQPKSSPEIRQPPPVPSDMGTSPKCTTTCPSREPAAMPRPR